MTIKPGKYSLASILTIPLILCFSWILLGRTSMSSCTIFTISNDETSLFGNNEDHYGRNPVIWFNPASTEGHGSVHVGFRNSDGSLQFQGAVNDQGLAWDVNGLPPATLTPHPEMTFSHATDNYLSAITAKAATVEEAIKISRDFDFGATMRIQVHVADASRDAVVISAGPDGEIAYTRKPPGNGYLVSTNFNLANPENGTKSWRYDKATALLDELLESTDMTMEDAARVLSEVHLEDLVSYTSYSNVFDLKNGTIALNYMAQLNETIHLDMMEELKKGQRVVEMRDLFSKATVEAGDAAYRQLEMRTLLTKAGAVVALLAVIGAALIAVRTVRKSRNVKKQSFSSEVGLG